MYVNHVAFVITTDIQDFSGEKNKQEKIEYLADGFTEADANTKPAKLAALQSLISRLSGRKDEEIPRGKGYVFRTGLSGMMALSTLKNHLRYVNEDLILVFIQI
ncbi:Uncharacterised protein [Klebsiella pneumoniae]|nr:Uncharacterised protein [Klebsiella pneumoniae]